MAVNNKVWMSRACCANNWCRRARILARQLLYVVDAGVDVRGRGRDLRRQYSGRSARDRVNRRNGYRGRDWDARVGTIELPMPKLREGTYFPAWLLERRRRAEQALISVVATSYLLGVSTRRVEKLVQTLGIEGMSKS